jgi:LCP family protein required for cell wall assembly
MKPIRVNTRARLASVPHRQTSIWSIPLLGFLMAALLGGFAYSGYLLYDWSRAVAAAAPQLPSLALPRLGLPAVVSSETGQPLATPQAQGSFFSLLTPLQKKERVNVLLLGDDRRPDEPAAHLTDTIIVLTFDPDEGDAGMLSIPRDLWVPIPGFGENRINTAFVTGELRDYPGGGAALAKATVAELLGHPIHYYVMVNFDGFKQIIDLVGCIDITVSEDIDDPKYPDNNYGYDPLFIPAGEHCMDGELALKYARTRRQGADYARARRQQQVLVALKDKLLGQNLITELLPRLPALAISLGDAVRTDLPLDDGMALARALNRLDLDTVDQLVIDETLTTPTVTEAGAWVLLPNREAIRPRVDALFEPPAPVSEEEIRAQQEQLLAQKTALPTEPAPTLLPAESDERRRLTDEAARIVVHNGTATPGLAVQATEWLESQGFLVVSFGDADRSDYAHSVLVDYTGKQYTLQRLIEIFQVQPENVRVSTNLKSPVDLRLILGQDWQIP